MKSAGSPNPIRVILCDDHQPFRRGLAEMLAVADDIEVAGEANTHERAAATVSKERPDVVLLDLEMPGMGAEETMRRMLSLPQPPRIVIVTMRDEPRLIRRFIGAGASAYLPKSATLEELLDAVRNAAASPHSPPGGAGARGSAGKTSMHRRMACRDGNWRYCCRTFRSPFDDPEVGGLLATVRDVTERKRLERALLATSAPVDVETEFTFSGDESLLPARGGSTDLPRHARGDRERPQALGLPRTGG